jgi:glycine amidinotransferase
MARHEAGVQQGVVCCHNEWDPLEEVIVGTAEGAAVPSWHVSLKATMPERHWPFFQQNGGRPFDKGLLALANRELDEFAARLRAEGVIVRRPQPVDFSRPYSTPSWSSACGLYAAMPRDLLLVIGNEIIETPSAWRSRYFEMDAYRALLKEYFAQGAMWSAAPKPQLLDELYDQEYEVAAEGEPMRYVVNNFEPVFDAADFVRCGTDIFYIKSHVTNEMGVSWLQRHLGPRYIRCTSWCAETPSPCTSTRHSFPWRRAGSSSIRSASPACPRSWKTGKCSRRLPRARRMIWSFISAANGSA